MENCTCYSNGSLITEGEPDPEPFLGSFMFYLMVATAVIVLLLLYCYICARCGHYCRVRREKRDLELHSSARPQDECSSSVSSDFDDNIRNITDSFHLTQRNHSFTEAVRERGTPQPYSYQKPPLRPAVSNNSFNFNPASLNFPKIGSQVNSAYHFSTAFAAPSMMRNPDLDIFFAPTYPNRLYPLTCCSPPLALPPSGIPSSAAWYATTYDAGTSRSQSTEEMFGQYIIAVLGTLGPNNKKRYMQAIRRTIANLDLEDMDEDPRTTDV